MSEDISNDDFGDYSEYSDSPEPARPEPPEARKKVVPYTKWDRYADGVLIAAGFLGVASFNYPWLSEFHWWRWFRPEIVASNACVLAGVLGLIRVATKERPD